MSEGSATLPHLGIVLPDDPIESEIHTLNRWLCDHGRSDVRTTTVLSKMMGGHVAEDLDQRHFRARIKSGRRERLLGA